MLDNERILSYGIWERYKVRSLMDTIVMYSTFRNMVQSLWGSKAKNAMDFFRKNFLVDFGHEVNPTIDTNDAEYLADEGVLVPGEVVGSFKLSSPLVRWLILQHVIPAVFSSCPSSNIPFLVGTRNLDTLYALRLAIKYFDKDVIFSGALSFIQVC